jgi:hypothetical protein
MDAAAFLFPPGIRLHVSGGERAVAHFRTEYAGTETALDGAADLEIEFTRASDGQRATFVRGGHKTVRWNVALDEPGTPLRATIELAGRPLTFGLSLVQGYFVEPLLSLAAARQARVLLPAAAIAEDGGALLVIGRSGSGKSTLSARALASGAIVVGDDQILIDADGRCWPFPRRMRFYSDLPVVAPHAYARLDRRTRNALLVRRLMRLATRGYVSPPVRVPASALGTRAADALPLQRIAVVERVARPDLHIAELGVEATVERALEVLGEQRGKLPSTDAAWAPELAQARATEGRVLRKAFAESPIEHVFVPAEWDARRAVDTLAELLRTERTAGSDGRAR